MADFSELKQRVTLLWTTTKADEKGKEVWTDQSLGFVWACIKTLANRSRLRHDVERKIAREPPTLYEICIREQPTLKQDIDSIGQNRDINAVQWKGKDLVVISPFRSTGERGQYWKALCKERGK